MTKFQKYGVVAFIALVAVAGATFTFFTMAKKQSAVPAASSASAANPVVDRGWAVRCPDKTKTVDKKSCEVFTRLEMKDSSMRVAEFAVGFPSDKSLPIGAARGVIVLPLGISLQAGTSFVKIDDGTPFAFSSRFCTQAGCLSYVDLDKGILDSMRKGKSLNLIFKTSDNRNMNVIMNLGNFAKALDSIQ